MQTAAINHHRARAQAFSLVEVLAATAIIGIITFLAIPNIVTVRDNAEQNLAITRAEAVNMAIAAFIQSRGRANAADAWDDTTTAQQRYSLLAPFLAFAPATESAYMPGDAKEGYFLEYPSTLASLTKITMGYDPDKTTADDEWYIGY